MLACQSLNIYVTKIIHSRPDFCYCLPLAENEVVIKNEIKIALGASSIFYQQLALWYGQ